MTYTGKVGYAILLAGGKSSRMREDKALLTLHNKTLLDYQNQLLTEVADKVLVSRDDGQAGHIADTFADAGPLAGVHACISYITDNYSEHLEQDVIVLPVDMPLITSALINQLVSYGREFNLPCYFRDTNLPIYLPRISGLKAHLEEMLNGDRRILNTFLDEIRAKNIVCHEPDKIANANTPMQWKLLKRAAES